jgi:chromosome partitioning protein
VLIDCPPSLNVLTLNALAAADAVIVPLQCEFFAMEGLGLLMDTIEEARKSLNPNLIIQGVILTMHDGRQALTRQVEEDVRAFLGDKVYVNTIPRNVRLSEAPSFGQPALVYDMNCKGSQAYINVARELIRRERGLAAA